MDEARFLRRIAVHGRAGIPVWDILDEWADQLEGIHKPPVQEENESP